MTFRQNFFVSLPKNLPVEPFILSRYRKTFFLLGLDHEILWKSFCPTAPDFFVAEPFCVSEEI